MPKKRKSKQQRMIEAYIARAVVALVLVIMVVLMFCGCLYIHEHFFAKDTKSGNDTKVEADANVDKTEDDQSQEVSDSDPQAEITDPNNESKYKNFSVVLDAGHGGYDGGTLNGDILEKDINLAVVLAAATLLEEEGVTVTLTRSIDEFISLENRVSIANQTTANLFVSLHCNFFEDDDSVDGLEAFYVEGSDGSQLYAESIASAAQTNPNIIVRGATANAYYVTRNTSMDAVLVEMGFLSNTAECNKLASSDYQKEMAQAVVDGILQQFDAQLGITSDDGTMQEDATDDTTTDDTATGNEA